MKINTEKEKPNYLTMFKKHIGLVLFLIMSTIAIFSYDEYGIGWDEINQRQIGTVNYNYVFSGNQELLTFFDRDYGVAFELPLILIEKAFNLTDTRSVYLMRHLVTHLFFLLGAFFCFKLIDLLYKDKLLATIGFLLITLHPCLYSHSFFNTKDIPFMSMFIICLYFNAIAFREKTIKSFIILGISIGLLINMRIMGVLLPCCVLLFLFIDAMKEKKYINHLKLGLIFLAIAALVLYATWPILWTDPVKNFWTVYKNMSSFRWSGSVLFNGSFIVAAKLGWDYIPVWFSITTPIFYLILGLFGIFLLIYHFVTNPLAYIDNSTVRNNVFFFVCFFAPVFAVIILHSTLYDGWRQMYFIYPSFVMLAIYGLHFIPGKKIKTWIIGGSFLSFICISFFMINNFPIQNVYFNSFYSFRSPEYLRKNFELDYWGVSYKQSLEYILKHDDSPSINVCVGNSPGLYNYLILEPDQRIRIKYVSIQEAKYFITNYRWHPGDYEEFKGLTFHSLKVSNSTVNEIFKLQ
jgi:hypothetical protein